MIALLPSRAITLVKISLRLEASAGEKFQLLRTARAPLEDSELPPVEEVFAPEPELRVIVFAELISSSPDTLVIRSTRPSDSKRESDPDGVFSGA